MTGPACCILLRLECCFATRRSKQCSKNVTSNTIVYVVPTWQQNTLDCGGAGAQMHNLPACACSPLATTGPRKGSPNQGAATAELMERVAVAGPQHVQEVCTWQIRRDAYGRPQQSFSSIRQ